MSGVKQAQRLHGVLFDEVGFFAANNAARMALRLEGFSLGPSQRGAPIAVMFGDYRVGKWRNLNQDERRETHATLTGDNRDGPLTLRLLPAAPDEAVEAVRRIAEARGEATPSTGNSRIGGGE